MKTCTFNPLTHKVVPIHSTDEMSDAAWESDDNAEYFDNVRYLTRSDLTYSAMVAKAPEYPADAGWISVDERLPLEHVSVLISFVDQYQNNQVVHGCYFKLNNGALIWNQNTEFCEAKGGWEGATIDHQSLKPTHWMPLPPAPEGV